MKIQASTIEELFSASGEQEADLRQLDRLMVKTVPNLKRQLFSEPSITMIGYGEMMWMNKSASSVWPLISVAPQKGNISIYVAAEKDGAPLAMIYRKRLGKTNNARTVSASNVWQMFRWKNSAMPFWMPSNGARCRRRSMEGIAPSRFVNDRLDVFS